MDDDTPNTRLRVATPADVAEIQRVRNSVRENVLSSPGRITDAMVAEHLTALGRGWVCERDGRLVGFAIANRRDASIWALFVEPGHEGRGIGRALHDTMLAWLRAEGLATVRLGTAPGTRAERFYRRAGWRATGLDAHGALGFEIDLRGDGAAPRGQGS